MDYGYISGNLGQNRPFRFGAKKLAAVYDGKQPYSTAAGAFQVTL